MTAIKAILDTINPKEGNGVKETIIFVVIIAVLLTLNILGKPVTPELQYALYTILGYMVGTNAKKQLSKDSKTEDNQDTTKSN